MLRVFSFSLDTCNVVKSEAHTISVLALIFGFATKFS